MLRSIARVWPYLLVGIALIGLAYIAWGNRF